MQGSSDRAAAVEENQSVLSSTESMVRWTLKRKLVANALSSATQFLLLAHTPVSRKVFQVSGHSNGVYSFPRVSSVC